MKILFGSAAALTLTLFAAQANAVPLTLDDFDDLQQVELAVGVNDIPADSEALTGLPFDTRTLDLSRNLLGSGNPISAGINTGGLGFLNFENGADAAATLTVLYELDTSPAVDFTNGGVNDTFTLRTETLSETASFSVELTSATGTATATGTLAETSGFNPDPIDNNFLFSDFLTTGTFSFAEVTTMLLTFEPDGPNLDGEFSILTTEDNVPPPGVIPLPASGVLLLAGLGGIAMLRRRAAA